MTAPRIRADHDQLKTIAVEFRRQEDTLGRLITQVRQPLEVLRGGDWTGRSATAFYAEMDQSVLPSLLRLRQALARAGQAVQRLSDRLRTAEADAAAALRDRTAFEGRADFSGAAALVSGGADVLGTIGGFLWDVLAGGAAELGDMVSGLISLVKDPGAALRGLWYGVTHPGELWDAFTKPYVEDWNNGHPGRSIGRGLVFVGSFLLGTKGGEKVASASSLTGKVAEVGETAGKLGDLAGEAGKLGDLASGLGKIGELSLPRAFVDIVEPFKQLPKPVQALSDVNDLMRAATEGQSALAGITERVAALTGGRAEIAPLKFASEKGFQRGLDKVAEYGGDASQLKDLVRSRVVFGSLDEAYNAVRTVAKEAEVVFLKDRYAVPVDSGFRDLLLNVKLPNGHIAELRLSTDPIEALSKLEHPVYEQVRVIESAAKAAGRDLTQAEKIQVEALRVQFRPDYNAAYEKLLQEAWASRLGATAPGADALRAVGGAGVAGEILQRTQESDPGEGTP